MPVLLFLLCLPLIEIALFVLIGGWIGLWPTLALVIASSLGGVAVVRAQGARSLAQLRQSIEGGGEPTAPLARGAFMMAAGVLLFVPGFLTSACGLLLMIPPVRRWLIRRGAGRLTLRAASLRRARPAATRDSAAGPRGATRAGAIEADYEVIGEDDVGDENSSRPGRSGWTRHH